MYPHALNINNFLSTFKVVFPAQNLHQQHQRRYKRSAASRIIYYTGLPNRPCCYQNYRVVTEEKSEHTKEYIAHNKPINDPNGEKKPRTHSPIQQLHIHRRNFWGTEATSDWLHPRCSEPAIWYVECELLVKPDVSFFFAASWCSSFADPFKTLTAQLWSDQSKGYGSESLRRGGHNPKSPRQVNRIDYNISYYCYIQAREPRSFDVWGRPLVGVGGLLALSSWCMKGTIKGSEGREKKSRTRFIEERMLYTCIHVSSVWRSGDASGELMAGGKGWISFGTTTRSLPKTKIAPALFAVPVQKILEELRGRT